MRKCLSVFVILVGVVGCRHIEKNNAGKIIHINLEKMHKVALQGNYAKEICLTDNDTLVLLDELKKILFVDGQYIIQGRNKVLAFDAQSGVLKTSFSGKGKTRTEFISLWDIWVEDSLVCIYDMDAKKILKHHLNGNFSDVIFVTAKTDIYPFQALVRMGESYYVGKRVFGMDNTRELNLYDKNFEFVREIGGENIKSGIYMHYPFFEYCPDEVLYNRYFSNDVYAIDDKQNMALKYSIDFGEKNLPVHLGWQDEYDCIDFINNSQENYATLVSNIYESDNYFCFRFAFDGEKCLGVYDKSDGKTASFVFVSSSESPRADVYVFDEQAVVITQDMDKTCLTTISVDDLLKIN